MDGEIGKLIQRYQQKGILVDTNILLLLFVGRVNPDRIERFKRTQTYSINDYNLLLELLPRFSQIITTPNILTEVNSLLNKDLRDPEYSQCLSLFSFFLSENESLQLYEIYVETKKISKMDKLTQFGLTDCGIADLAAEKYLVLTDDLRLASYLQSINIDVLNFNHIRYFS
ncbi:MAG: PIN domain-containing protein [Cyanobacteria bacterium P01_E01_bin.42]